MFTNSQELKTLSSWLLHTCQLPHIWGIFTHFCPSLFVTHSQILQICHSFFEKNATHFNDFCHSFSLSQIEGLWKWGTSRIFRILDHTFWKLLVGKSAFCPPSMNWYDAKDNQEQSIIVWYVEAVKILATQITTIILVTAEWIEMSQCHEIDPKRLFSIFSS